MFTNLLIHTCDIQEKTLTKTGYEQIKNWANIATDIACRKDTDNSVGISDTGVRVNTEDDIFFFEPTITISRGNRIIFENENYDVIKVSKVSDSKGVHHLEVKARYVDHD